MSIAYPAAFVYASHIRAGQPLLRQLHLSIISLPGDHPTSAPTRQILALCGAEPQAPFYRAPVATVAQRRKPPSTTSQRSRPKMLTTRSALAAPGAGWARPARSLSSAVVRSAAPALTARAAPPCTHLGCADRACAQRPLTTARSSNACGHTSPCTKKSCALTSRPLTTARSSNPCGHSDPCTKSSCILTTRRQLSSAPKKEEETSIEKSGTSWKEITDRMSQVLFLTDIWRGIWLTGEVVSKPKVTINYPFEKGPISPRFRGEHGCGATLRGKSAASPASSARPSARRKRSRSRPRRAKTGQEKRRATTST